MRLIRIWRGEFKDSLRHMLSKKLEMRRRALTRQVWQYLGTADPDWAVLTEPDRRNHGWDRHLDAFYESGRKAVKDLVASIPGPNSNRRAMDWGTGTGRLAFALATEYDEVIAVDIAESMLEIASQRMLERRIENVRLWHAYDYTPSENCDLVISQLSLQHLASKTEVLEVLEILARSLAPNGWMVIEVPASSVDLRGCVQVKVRLHRLLRMLGVPLRVLRTVRLSGISSLTIPPQIVTAALAEMGLTVRVWLDRSDGFHYMRYAAVRK
jgi:2-polyprenyl-3-methyl-5-hydroxy-6-metoxy-1,4-benzoquinol methylase